MPGNTTSLYSVTGSQATVSGTNTSGLYGTTGAVTVGSSAYGNANVAGYLPVYGGNILANIITANGVVVSGTVTATTFIGNVTGNISGNIVAPGSNTEIIYNDSGVLNGSANLTYDELTNVLSTGTVSAQANLTALGNVQGQFLLGNGAFISGLPAGYSNVDVTNFLANGFGSNTITTTGNVSVGNLAVGTNATITNDLTVGGTIFGTFSGNITGNLVVPGANTEIIYNNSGNAGASSDFTFDDATNVMTVNGTANVGVLTATGNITGNYIFGNGSQLTGLPATYGNANVANFLATGFGSNTITTTGNITAGYFVGNGSALTDITAANVTGTVANATYALSANSATFAGTVTTNAQPNITSVGNLTSLTVTNDALVGGNLTVNGNITYINSNTVTINDKFINVANNAVTSNAANGGGIGVGPVGSEYATWSFSDANTAWQSNIKIESPSLTTTGNVTAGNVITSAQVQAATAVITGNVIAGNILTDQGDFSGNVTANYFLGNGSLLTGVISSLSGNLAGNIEGNGFGLANAAFVTATGNVTANYFIGDGSQLTNLPPGDYSNANVANYLPTFSGNVGAGNVIFTSTTGRLYVNEIQGLAGAGLSIASDGTEDINLNADTVRIGDNNADATLATHGTGDLILRTHAGSASEGNIRIYDGASGNIDITTNGSGVVNIAGTGGLRVSDGITASGNITTTADIRGNVLYAQGNVISFGDNDDPDDFIQFVPTVGMVFSTNGTQRLNLTSGQVQATGALSATTTITAQSGNITATAGNVVASGNVVGNYFIGNGSQLTGIVTSPGGSNTQIQYNNNGSLAGNAAFTFNQATGLVSATGNIIAANLQTNNLLHFTGDSIIIDHDGTIGLNSTIAIGSNVANSLNEDAIHIGRISGVDTFRMIYAIGLGAATHEQGPVGNAAIAIGQAAGRIQQGEDAIAIGRLAGSDDQPARSVLIGASAGYQGVGSTIGNNAIGIGAYAIGNAVANSIVIDAAATDTDRTDGLFQGFYVRPVRNDTTNVGNVMFYNTTSRELIYANTISIAGNITGGNVTATSTVTGTLANLGNIRINAANIFNTNSSNISAVTNPARIILGNITATGIDSIGNAAVVTGGTGTLGNTAAVFTGTTISNFTTLSANVSNNSTRLAGLQTFMVLNGNTSNFGYEPTTGPRAFTVFNNQLRVGTSDLVGVAGQNGTRVTSAAMAFNQLRISPTSNVATGFGGISEFTLYRASPSSKGGTTFAAAANIGNVIGHSISMPAAIGANGQPNSPSLVTTVYHPSNVSTYGVSIDNQFRQATDYHFLRCDDNAAINYMGSIARMHSRMANSATTTGTININKNNGQAQRIELTGNVTIGDLQNFVTTSTNGSTTFSEEDNVRVYIVQGATGYTVTMPTGNTSIRYLGNTSTVSNVANTTSCLNITAINTAAGAQYLINIQTYGA